MKAVIIIINLIAASLLCASFFHDRKKTKQSLEVAKAAFLDILPIVLIVVVIIGIFISFMPPESISQYLGNGSNTLKAYVGIFAVSLLGAIVFIPALLSFPLAASLLQGGASVTAVASFLTTLTMLGVVTIPLEVKELGWKMALLRNALSFIIAIIIGVIMGLIL